MSPDIQYQHQSQTQIPGSGGNGGFGGGSSYSPPVTIPPIQMISGFFSDTNQNRKRSFSVVEGMENTPESGRGNRLSSISSILNPEQQRGSTEDAALDPSLHRRNASQGSLFQGQQQGPASQQYHARQGHGGVGGAGGAGGVSGMGQGGGVSGVGAMDYEDSASAGSGSGSGSSSLAHLEKSTRKAQLKREADLMRAMLEAKERELQELDGEG